MIIAGGSGIHWPDIDEDIDVKTFLKADQLLDWSDGLVESSQGRLLGGE